VSGLWIGLSIGLVFVAVVLTLTWHRRTARFGLPEHAPGLPDLL
jgi:hypothetical protein